MGTLNIALTKGRLEEKTIKLLTNKGIDCSSLINKGRKLIVNLNDNFNVVFAKANDVVTYVEYGVADVGVVGKDTLMEMGRQVHEVLDLGFGKCKFSIASLNGKDIFNKTHTVTIATKYPTVAKRYFEEKNIDVVIVKIEGSVELAPILGIADAIIDLVETGATLKENGLTVNEDIAEISARLIANTSSLRFKKDEINSLIKLLTGEEK